MNRYDNYNIKINQLKRSIKKIKSKKYSIVSLISGQKFVNFQICKSDLRFLRVFLQCHVKKNLGYRPRFCEFGHIFPRCFSARFIAKSIYEQCGRGMYRIRIWFDSDSLTAKISLILIVYFYKSCIFFFFMSIRVFMVPNWIATGSTNCIAPRRNW